MRSSHVGGWTLTTSLIAFGIGLAVASPASADPSDGTGSDAPAPPGLPWAAGLPWAPNAAQQPPDGSPLFPDAPPPAPGSPPPVVGAPPQLPAGNGLEPAAAACKYFRMAMDVAASSYEDFAYSAAGGGQYVDYGSPFVQTSNTSGRSGLKQAAVLAMEASTLPGVPPDVSGPMQLWSVHAAQLIATMGLGGNGDALNSSASSLNDDAKNVQMACAANGVHA